MDERAEIKERLSISEVVQAYLPLKQSGRNLKANCPFHQEKSASFMVNPERGIYHCFGCSESGDIFSFVMKMEGLDFREALEKLARQAGVELTGRRPEDAGAAKKKARLLEAHMQAVRYFQASLVQNPKALEYAVKQRGLGKDTLKEFQIGYAPDSWNALSDFLSNKGYTYQELLEAGLAGQKAGRQTVYDLFRGRLVFPICDRDGQPIGFTARVLDDSLPKYLNTPQTPLYDKSRAIFGLHLAKEAIREHDEVVLVEGNMDVVASHQAGVKQVVAASGTALTLDQLRALSKLTKNVKLAFDNDRAGLAATERAIELGQQLGLTLRMVVVEGAKDADELIKQDPEAWAKAIAGAKYIVDYLFDRYRGDFDLDSVIGKRQYTDKLAATVRRLGDPVEQDHYIKRLAGEVGTSEEAVRMKVEQEEAAPAVARPASGAMKAGGPAGGGKSAGAASGGQAAGAGGNGQPRAGQAGSEGAGRSSAAGSSASAGGRTSGPVAATPAARPAAPDRSRQTLRSKLEDELLAICLFEPLTRVALEDLTAAHFGRPESKALYEAMCAHEQAPAAEVIAALPEPGYAQDRIFFAETKLAEADKTELPMQALTISGRLQDEMDVIWRRELALRLSEAEAAGNAELRDQIIAKISAINTRKY